MKIGVCKCMCIYVLMYAHMCTCLSGEVHVLRLEVNLSSCSCLDTLLFFVCFSAFCLVWFFETELLCITAHLELTL